ncbi:hypothetical protein Tco_1321960 [Tanacetum coccineum]
MVSTRNNGITRVPTLESLYDVIMDIKESMNAFLVAQNKVSDEINKLKSGEGTSAPDGGSNTTRRDQSTRHGENVKGWLFGEDCPWNVYEKEVLKRFGPVFDDPLMELKKLKQDGTVKDYQEKFEALLNMIELEEKHAISLFLGGLKSEISLQIRMFTLHTLTEAFYMAKMQEHTLVALKSRYTPLLPTPNPKSNNNVPYGSRTNSVPVKPNTNYNKNPNRTRLTQKEYEEKRASNMCFYEIVETDIGMQFSHKSPPQISLNALTGVNNFPTMRVKGYIGKQQVDFQKLTMSFTYKKQHVLLKGTPQATLQWMQGNKVHRGTLMMCICSPMLLHIETKEWDIAKVESVVKDFEDVFALPTELPPKRSHDHQIRILPNTLPVNIRPYRHPPVQKDAIE